MSKRVVPDREPGPGVEDPAGRTAKLRVEIQGVGSSTRTHLQVEIACAVHPANRQERRRLFSRQRSLANSGKNLDRKTRSRTDSPTIEDLNVIAPAIETQTARIARLARTRPRGVTVVDQGADPTIVAGLRPGPGGGIKTVGRVVGRVELQNRSIVGRQRGRENQQDNKAAHAETVS